MLFHAWPTHARRPRDAIICTCSGLPDNRACTSPTEPEPDKDMPPAAQLLEPAALQRLRDLDPSGSSRLVERVFKAFEDSIARLRPQLLRALEAGDAPGMRHVAHTLKSSSASIGAIKLSELCAEMESMARQGQTDGMTGRTDELCAEMDAVLAALKTAQTDQHPA